MDSRSAPRYPIQYPIAFSGDLIAGQGTVTDVSNTDSFGGSSLVKATGIRIGVPALGAEEQERLRRFVSALESTQNR